MNKKKALEVTPSVKHGMGPVSTPRRTRAGGVCRGDLDRRSRLEMGSRGGAPVGSCGKEGPEL